MEGLQVFVGLVLLLTRSVDSYLCPVMEGDSITLTCTVPISSSQKFFFWIRELDNNPVTVATCEIGNKNCHPGDSRHTSNLTSVNTSNATSIFTIPSAERIDQGSWTCSTPSPNVSPVCDVKVFAKPISVSCGQPELQNTNVKVTCAGEKVYPEPLCLFSWIRNGTDAANNQAVVNQSLSEQGSPSYFYPKCIWTAPAQSLGFGSHQFKVLIYPNVTETNTDWNYGTSSNLTTPVNITIPDVVLEDCPVDFVQEGTTVSCSCKEKNNLFLLADVTWSGGSGAPVVGKQNSDLTFQAAKNSPNYTCQAEILDTKSASILYVPKVAYGPDHVVVKVLVNNNEKTVIDLCGKPPASEKIKVSCSVPENDVGPNAIIQCLINGTNQMLGTSSYVDYSVTKGGNLSVECNAKNTLWDKFQTLYTQNRTFLQVREPPGPPTIEAEQKSLSVATNTDNQLTVEEGLARIRCRAEGGYPAVTDLALNCSGSNTVVGNEEFLDVNITRKMNSQPCYCTVNHVSPCYVNNMATSTFNVLFPPTITSYTVSGSTNLTVHNNTDVMFSCEAEGNPSPDLFLLRDSYSNKLGNIDSNNQVTFKFNKTMTCQDTGVYVCQVQTQKADEKERVQVNVFCKQQLAASENQNRAYSGQVNESLNINISVFGYPEPELSLQSSTILERNVAYDLIYFSISSGHGTVSLNIFTLIEAYFQKYDLSITNSQGTLVYSFEITLDSNSGINKDPNVGAIAGGIAAGVFVFIVIVLAVFILRRNGFLSKKSKERKEDDHRAKSGHHGGEVTVENMDIYDLDRKSNEALTVEFDNSDIYNMNHNDAVVIDNSDIYNMNHSEEEENRRSAYKKYSDITPTITSATAAPKNMKTVVQEPILDNPYEDVERDAKTQKPQLASKPKPAIKPKTGQSSSTKIPTEGKKGMFELQDDGKNQTYASVNKVPKSTDEIPLQDKKTGSSAHADGVSSSQDSSFAYTNSGFSDMGDDMNVYANTE